MTSSERSDVSVLLYVHILHRQSSSLSTCKLKLERELHKFFFFNRWDLQPQECVWIKVRIN